MGQLFAPAGASIPGTIPGGSDGSVLFVHPAGTLTQLNPGFTFDQSAGNLTLQGGLFPGTPANAVQAATRISAGTGAPNNADGANGDFYFRSDASILYQRVAGVWTVVSVAPAQVTASLGANVSLNNTGLYFDGPSVNVGSAGIWFAIASVSLIDSANAAFNAKLWDGTNVVNSVRSANNVASGRLTITLGGVFTNPAGNLKISVNDPTAATGSITFNDSGNSKDSTITAWRIA